jgi:hypothetical protein
MSTMKFPQSDPRITVTLTPELLAFIERAAREESRSLAGQVRHLIVQAARAAGAPAAGPMVGRRLRSLTPGRRERLATVMLLNSVARRGTGQNAGEAASRSDHGFAFVRAVPRGRSASPSPSFCSPVIGPLNLISAASGA